MNDFDNDRQPEVGTWPPKPEIVKSLEILRLLILGVVGILPCLIVSVLVIQLSFAVLISNTVFNRRF